MQHGIGESSDQIWSKSSRALVIAALGVVYGDIGTSPLYALRECVSGEHGVARVEANILGLLSLFVWSLLLVISGKYLTFVMRADNRGEGGILALLGLVSSPSDRAKPSVGLLTGLVLFGAGLLYGDGVITPAISVLGAIEGLAVAAPSLEPLVVPVTCAVLAGLFLIQKRGTAKVGALFGPVMVLWFLTLGVTGLANAWRDLSILRAINPMYAVNFFVENGGHAFRVLGSVVLVFTGGEALFADMGHFGRTPIRRAWYALVLPSLVLNYMGQGALLLHNPAANPFFDLVPDGVLTWGLVLIATCAAIIASQALITGVYSLTSQAVQLGLFPRVTVKHTSDTAEGQIYIPEVNSALAVACIALVLAFGSSSNLAAAYGIAVTGTMGITSVAFYVVCRRVWGWPVQKALPLLLLFLCFDLPFFFANVLKLFHGGLVPILIGAFFFVGMATWKRGRAFLSRHFQRTAWPMERFLGALESRQVRRVGGGCVVMASTDQYVPLILTHFVRHAHVLHEVVVLLTVRVESEARLKNEERLVVSEMGHGLWRLVVRYGYMESPDVPAALSDAATRLGLPVDVGELTYIIGRETIVPSKEGDMRGWQEHLFAYLSRNALPATAYFRLPTAQVMELGFQLDL